MTDAGKDQQEVRDDATDSRTLDEIEEDENVPTSEPESQVPSPDEGAGRDRETDGTDPM